jgi:hypothetical protein
VTNHTIPTPETVRITKHAANQYQQRVKPALDVDAARAELERLRLVGKITANEPRWVNAARPAPYYPTISDAAALLLAPQDGGWLATTCVTASTYTPARRAQRRAHKASKMSRKRAERRARW